MKKEKQKIRYISSCTYYFPGLKYAEKLLKMEDKFLDKLYWKRRDQISNKNGKFKWTEENLAKIYKISDLAYEKYMELLQKIQELDKKFAPLAVDYPDYHIEGTLYCGLELPNGDDFYTEVCTGHICKDHKLDVVDWQLGKDISLPWKALKEAKLSYPMYCLLEEHRMAVDEVIQLTEDNFYIEINIEVE